LEIVMTTTWILAFDAGCSTCSAITGKVQAVAGSRLQVRSLRDARVEELRRQAYGTAEAPWAPTLLQTGRPVRAWTGTALSLRLAGLLGPTRSVRVIRALLTDRPVVVSDPDRRRVLTAVSALGAATFLLTGGLSGGWAAAATRGSNIPGAGAQIPLTEAVTRVFGVAADTVRLRPADAAVTAHAAGAAAQTEPALRLRADLHAGDVAVGEPTVSTADLRFTTSPAPHERSLSIVRHPLHRGGSAVGELAVVSAPGGAAGHAAVAVIRNLDGTTTLTAHTTNGHHVDATYDRNGTITSGPRPLRVAAGISCKAVCGILCNTGWGAGLAGCVGACLETGPGEILCAPLCGLLIAGVCFLGCATICCSCCNDC